MRTFKDAAERTWEIAVTIGAAKRIKDKLGVDLLRLDKPGADDDMPLLTRLGVDELLLAEIICCLIGEDQFAKQGVTEEQIAAAFDGTAVLAAQKAFYEELIDFFQKRGREYLAKAIKKQLATIDAAAAKAEAILDEVDPEEISGRIFGESPDKSASTPGR